MSYRLSTFRMSREEIIGIKYSVITVLFGTRIGLVIYLATLCIFGALLRAEFLITDSYTLANGLYSLSNGQFILTDAVYGSGLQTPGAERINGNLIARNYGAIVLSLPFWAFIAGLSKIADLAVAVISLWSLVALLLTIQVGRIIDTRYATAAGGVTVMLLFAINVAFVEPVSPHLTYLLALQFFHATVAAFVPVLCYRLFTRLETTRLGIIAAFVAALGTPLGVWGMYPKRHALTAAVAMVIVYALYRSRKKPDGVVIANSVSFRALAYAMVGLYAWIHAPEALVILIVLAVVDIPTAPDNSPRSLAIVGTAFLLSIIPFLITNTIVVGHPLKPPRLVAASGEMIEPQTTGATPEVAEGGDGSRSEGGSIWIGLIHIFLSTIKPVVIMQREVGNGLQAIVDSPSRMYHTLIRSGATEGTLDQTGQQSVNLALLESAPVLAALLAIWPAVRSRLETSISVQRVLSGRRVADVFAVLLSIILILFYATRLPFHAQIVVRYLFPVYPLGVYLLFRLPLVRKTLAEWWQAFFWTTGVVVLIGSQIHVVGLYYMAIGLGEAMQLHALVALTVAVPLGGWALIGRNQDFAGLIGAVLMGLATGISAQFVLFVSTIYYPLLDSHILPIMRMLSESLPVF